MDGIAVQEQPAASSNLTWHAWLRPGRDKNGNSSLHHSLVRLFVSGGLNLFRFLRQTGLFNDPGLIILSQHDFATFRAGDLEKAATLITLRRLNLIKHLEMFLNSLVHLLPPETNFVGCFSQAGNNGGGVRGSGILNGFQDWIFGSGLKECQLLSSRKVSEILERNGLRIISMTEMNGLTYFHSRKVCGHTSIVV
ncbi:MAG: hypothetical protein U5L72_13100 [Bacteroidales bacterium]|nr:hypothetical protein [Bacteroidales bacterium]